METLILSIQAIQTQLEAAGIASILIGGVAVALWGEPRLTRDVDLKVLLPREEAGRLVECLGTDYTLLADDPRATLERHAMLFVLDRWSTRVDLLLGETAFDFSAVGRGRVVDVRSGQKVRSCTPEDLIVYKLISTRPRDLEDARSVVRRQGNRLDAAYVERWLAEFESALDDSTLLATFRGFRP